MAERRTPPATDPIYSEKDMLDARLKWEEAQKEQRLNEKLSQIMGQLSSLPDTVRTIAKQVVLEVLAEQQKSQEARNHTAAATRRSDLRFIVSALTGLIVVVVPIESALVHHFFP